MGRKLIVLLDGAWNNQEDRTNVTRMKESIVSTGENDPLQPFFYHPGVGQHWYDRMTGGAFGRGLSRNIQEGYQWLAQRMRADDELFVFGFSRGAYTACSLVGLIRKCGLLRTADDAMVRQAYDLYRDKTVAPDDPTAVAFRSSFAHEPRVRFIGVWDTVGSLGIPLSYVPFGKDYYSWHDTELSKIVDYADNAIAVDEHRKDFQVAVWTKTKEKNEDIEQRWFVGAHGNVGGGYHRSPPDLLPDITLRWMQDKAAAVGLALHAKVEVAAAAPMRPVDDSYGAFMFGVYKRFKHPFQRSFGRGVNEKVDDSVWLRWRQDENYRPATLLGHPDRPQR